MHCVRVLQHALRTIANLIFRGPVDLLVTICPHSKIIMLCIVYSLSDYLYTSDICNVEQLGGGSRSPPVKIQFDLGPPGNIYT